MSDNVAKINHDAPERLYGDATAAGPSGSAVRARMTRHGRWALWQRGEGEDDGWLPVGVWMGYRDRADAEADAERCNRIQPGRWRVRDRSRGGRFWTVE